MTLVWRRDEACSIARLSWATSIFLLWHGVLGPWPHATKSHGDRTVVGRSKPIDLFAPALPARQSSRHLHSRVGWDCNAHRRRYVVQRLASAEILPWFQREHRAEGLHGHHLGLLRPKQANLMAMRVVFVDQQLDSAWCHDQLWICIYS
jgi:hypothetical protein